MRKSAIAAALLSVGILVAGDPVRKVQFGFAPSSGPVPKFDKGYLISFGPGGPITEVSLYGPDGKRLYSATVHAPDGTIAHLGGGAAMDTDGTLAVGTAYAVPGAGIGLLDIDGRQTGFIQTGNYIVSQICFSPDHAIWTVGWQRDERNIQSQSDNYMVFHKYTRDGTLAGQFVPRSTFPRKGIDPAPVHPGIWMLWAAKDRVGAVLLSGTGTQGEWVELGLDGQLLGRWATEGDAFRSAVALTASGGLFLQSNGQTRVYDRLASAWKPVAVPVGYQLMGADGENLVFRDGSRVIWLPAGNYVATPATAEK